MKTFRCASLWLPQLNRAKKEEVKLKRARRKTIGVTINPFCGTTLILHSVGTYRDKSNLWPPYWVLKILQQVFNRPFRLPEKYGLVWLFGLSLYCCRLLTLQWKLPWDDDVVVIWWCVKKSTWGTWREPMQKWGSMQTTLESTDLKIKTYDCLPVK